MGDSHCLYIFGILLTVSLVSSGEQTDQDSNDQIINHIDNVRSGLVALGRSLDNAGLALEERAADQCRMGLSHAYCSTSFADHVLQPKEFVNSLINPRKRSTNTAGAFTRGERLLQDLLRKRFILQNIKDYLHQASQTLSDERKRSCNLNLGFHCQTEQYSAIADMYNFLQSAMSPGK